MGEVARINTPVPMPELARVLWDELNVRYPGAVTPTMAAMLFGQLRLESGNGAKIYNRNPGNLISKARDTDLYYRPTWWTDTKSKLHALAHANPPKAPRAFRAYMTIEDGIADYVNLLANPRFAGMIEAARSGNASNFAVAVESSGYCPDCDPAKTTKSFTSLYNSSLKYFEGEGISQEPPPNTVPESEVVAVDPSDTSALAALVGAGAIFVGARLMFRKR